MEGLAQDFNRFNENFSKFGKAFETYKEENDKRLKLLEGGKGTAEMQEKLDRIDAHLEKLEKEHEKIHLAYKRKSLESDATDEKNPEGKKIFHDYLRRGIEPTSEQLVKMVGHRDDYGSLAKQLSVGIDREGGFTVRPEMADQIIQRIYETSPIRQHADVKSTTSNSMEIPVDWDESGAEWADEASGSGAGDTSDFSMLEIFTHELRARPRATQQLIEDSAQDIESYISKKSADKFRRTENTAFVSGNGVKRPRGILTYPVAPSSDVNKYGTIQQVKSGNATNLTADAFFNLQGALLAEYDAGAKFFLKRVTATEVRKLKDRQDRYLLSITGRIGEPVMYQILDKPMVYCDDFPAIAANALAVAYANLKSGYCVLDRIGMTVLRDPFTAKPLVEFYTRKRVGGAVTNSQAIKIMKIEA